MEWGRGRKAEKRGEDRGGGRGQERTRREMVGIGGGGVAFCLLVQPVWERSHDRGPIRGTDAAHCRLVLIYSARGQSGSWSGDGLRPIGRA